MEISLLELHQHLESINIALVDQHEKIDAGNNIKEEKILTLKEAK